VSGGGQNGRHDSAQVALVSGQQNAHNELQAPFDMNASILAFMRELDEQASKVAGEILPMAQQGKFVPLATDGGKSVLLVDHGAARFDRSRAVQGARLGHQGSGG